LDICRFSKKFDTGVREALLWKLGKKAVPTKFIEGVKGIYRNVKITVKFEGNRVLEEFDSNSGLRWVFAVTSVIYYIY
jgi:hypothetical protein